jgi:hypothetical protein
MKLIYILLFFACCSLKADEQAMRCAEQIADVPSVIVAWLTSDGDESWVLANANVFPIELNNTSTSASEGRSLFVKATNHTMSSIDLAIKAKSSDGKVNIETVIELTPDELLKGKIISRSNVGKSRNLILIRLAIVRKDEAVDPFK